MKTFLSLVIAFISQSSLAAPLAADAPESLKTIVSTHQELISTRYARPSSKWVLDRLDVEVGLNASGEIGIIGAAGESAMELIWERDEKNLKNNISNEPEELSLEVTSDDPDKIFNGLKDQILTFLNDRSLSSRTRRNILRELRKDAEKIGLFVREIQTMPRIGDWYVDGFFKTYFFNIRGNILPGIQLGYDKRVRFRFSFSGIPLMKNESDKLSNIQKFHAKFMRGLQKISSSENPEADFRLTRVWARTEVTTSFNAIILQIGGGKAFQTVYRKVPESSLSTVETILAEIQGEAENFEAVQIASDKLLSPLAPSGDSTFPLSQVRLKFSWELGAGFDLAEVNKNSIVEFHFFRSK